MNPSLVDVPRASITYQKLNKPAENKENTPQNEPSPEEKTSKKPAEGNTVVEQTSPELISQSSDEKATDSQPPITSDLSPLVSKPEKQDSILLSQSKKVGAENSLSTQTTIPHSDNAPQSEQITEEKIPAQLNVEHVPHKFFSVEETQILHQWMKNLIADNGNPQTEFINLISEKLNQDDLYNSRLLRERIIKEILPNSSCSSEQLKKARYEIQQACQNAILSKLNDSNPPLSVEERNRIYVNFTDDLEQIHRWSKVDRALGIYNTQSWKSVITAIKKNALNVLFLEIDKIKTNDETSIKTKISKLEEAREMPLFKDHVNNSVFFGAYRRTQAVKEIDAMIEDLQKQLKSIKKLPANKMK